LQKHFADFKQALHDHDVPLKLFLAGEVRLSPESLDLFMADDVPFLGTVDGYRVVLLEFPHELVPVGSDRFAAKLLHMKIRPLIAHPERNKAILQNPDKIRPFVDMGCWLQLTSGSLVGRFGKEAKKVALDLLEDDLAWVVATDAHNMRSRPPYLAEGRDAVEAVLGAHLAKTMVTDRPARILGLDLESAPT
jgi:protein-tyrosine phosphatase